MASRTSRVRVWRGITQEGAIERTLREHAQVVAALELADPALVSARLIAHVSGVEDWVRRALAERPTARRLLIGVCGVIGPRAGTPRGT